MTCALLTGQEPAERTRQQRIEDELRDPSNFVEYLLPRPLRLVLTGFGAASCLIASIISATQLLSVQCWIIALWQLAAAAAVHALGHACIIQPLVMLRCCRRSNTMTVTPSTLPWPSTCWAALYLLPSSQLTARPQMTGSCDEKRCIQYCPLPACTRHMQHTSGDLQALPGMQYHHLQCAAALCAGKKSADLHRRPGGVCG